MQGRGIKAENPFKQLWKRKSYSIKASTEYIKVKMGSFMGVSYVSKIPKTLQYNFRIPPSSGMSEVHRVRLSLRSCIINVLSLYDSSFKVSNSDIASSKACFARWQALLQN